MQFGNGLREGGIERFIHSAIGGHRVPQRPVRIESARVLPECLGKNLNAAGGHARRKRGEAAFAIGRGPGQSQYVRLKQALQRLQSTVVLTTIRHGLNWRRMQFSWINEWEELVDARGQCHGVEFVLPEWFYRGVLDRSLVLTIDPAYFALSDGIERRLHRVARRHAGHQPKGWAFELRHLYTKSGSAARFSDFALDLRRIAARQSLPGYDLFIELENTRELLRVIPRRLSTGTVDSRVEPIRRSGARVIRLSGARLSADQAHGPQLTLWPATRNGACNDSNSRESNSSVDGARKAGIRSDGAAPSRPGRRH